MVGVGVGNRILDSGSRNPAGKQLCFAVGDRRGFDWRSRWYGITKRIFSQARIGGFEVSGEALAAAHEPKIKH